MSPDDAYLEKQAQAEEEKLQKKIQALSDSDKKEIYEKGNVDNIMMNDPQGSEILIHTIHEFYKVEVWPGRDGDACVLLKVWSCWLCRVKPRTPPVCLRSKCPTSSRRSPSLRSRWALQVQHTAGAAGGVFLVIAQR